MALKNPQTDLFAKTSHAKKADRFGGNRRTTRASRQFRPVSTRTSMHLILKSLQARGMWSLLTPKNKRVVREVVNEQSRKHGVQLLSWANGGNHLHVHLKVKSNASFKAFVRSLSGIIALKVTGASKVNKLKQKFWTQSPYTRFVHGVKDYLRLSDYIEINNIEGFGFCRKGARLYIGAINEMKQRFRDIARAGNAKALA